MATEAQTRRFCLNTEYRESGLGGVECKPAGGCRLCRVAAGRGINRARQRALREVTPAGSSGWAGVSLDLVTWAASRLSYSAGVAFYRLWWDFLG